MAQNYRYYYPVNLLIGLQTVTPSQTIHYSLLLSKLSNSNLTMYKEASGALSRSHEVFLQHYLIQNDVNVRN